MTILYLYTIKTRPTFARIADERLQPALDAANAWVKARCRVPDPAPGDLVKAVELLTARYLARENSPDGFVGMQETGGPVYIGRADRDVESLVAPYRRVVFG